MLPTSLVYYVECIHSKDKRSGLAFSRGNRQQCSFPLFLSSTRWASSRGFLRRWSRCRCLRRNCRDLGTSGRRLHLSMDLNICWRHSAIGHLCKGTRGDRRAGMKSSCPHRVEEKHSILLPLSVPICWVGVVVRHWRIRSTCEVIRSRFLGCLVERRIHDWPDKACPGCIVRTVGTENVQRCL